MSSNFKDVISPGLNTHIESKARFDFQGQKITFPHNMKLGSKALGFLVVLLELPLDCVSVTPVVSEI